MSSHSTLLGRQQNGHIRPQIKADYGSRFHYQNKDGNYGELWIFGPLGKKLYEDQLGKKDGEKYQQETKKKILEKVLKDSNRTLENLLNELKSILPAAKAAYAVGALTDFEDDQILKMLAEDSCFFLLVAFSILDAELGFPDQHPFFGTRCVRRDMKKWLRSIFLVGNQIPFVMVEKLMKSLKYFKELKNQISECEPLELELLKRALFMLLVTDFEEPKPTDVVDCLRSIALGPKCSSVANVWTLGSSKDVHDLINHKPSAVELSKLGYDFKPLHKKSGIRGIDVCERKVRSNILYLPVLEVVDDSNTELMIQCLSNYEYVHRGKIDPESTYFIKLLSELIQRGVDVDFLQGLGVIRGINLQRLPAILGPYYGHRLPDTISCVRREIKVPRTRPCWKNVKVAGGVAASISLCTFILAFLQTDYNLMRYYKKPYQ